jgi:hypothetical protein
MNGINIGRKGKMEAEEYIFIYLYYMEKILFIYMKRRYKRTGVMDCAGRKEEDGGDEDGKYIYISQIMREGRKGARKKEQVRR